MRERLLVLIVAAVLVPAASACSGGGGSSFVLHGTIQYRESTTCAGSLANAVITVAGTSGVVGSGKPIAVTGQVCDETGTYSIQVQRSATYAVTVRLSGAVSFSDGPYAFDRLNGHGFRLDIRIVEGKATTSPSPG